MNRWHILATICALAMVATELVGLLTIMDESGLWACVCCSMVLMVASAGFYDAGEKRR